MNVYDKALKHSALKRHKKIGLFIDYLLKNETKILLLAILIIGLVLRFYNYENRWGLAYDQARDVIVTHEALLRQTLPLIGPFSASGPFVFGPYWYWFNMLLAIIAPSWMMVHWVFQGIASTLMIIVAYKTGKDLYEKKFGLIFAFLVAISTAGIAQSTNLTYSTMVGFVCFLLLFFVVKYCHHPSNKYLFIIALTIGIAINIHFQAIGTLAYLPLLLLFRGISFKKIVVSAVGLAIPFIPILLFDFLSNHFQSRNLFDYFILHKGPPSPPKRWLTYGLVTWPNTWAHIIGGNVYLGYLLGIGLAFVVIKNLIKRKIPLTILLVMIYFLLNFIVLRYFGGALFDAFYVYLHPVILLLTSWLIWSFLKIRKSFGILLIVLVGIGTLSKNYGEIMYSTNLTAKATEEIVNVLKVSYPDKKFAVYDHQYKYGQTSFPLVMYLQAQGLISDNGVKIGRIVATSSADMTVSPHKLITGKTGIYQLFDLSSSTSSQLAKSQWAFINPSVVHESTVLWYKNKK